MKRLLSALGAELQSGIGTSQGAMQCCFEPVQGLSRAVWSTDLISPHEKVVSFWCRAAVRQRHFTRCHAGFFTRAGSQQSSVECKPDKSNCKDMNRLLSAFGAELQSGRGTSQGSKYSIVNEHKCCSCVS